MALTTDRPTEPELPDVRPTSSIYAANAQRPAHPRTVVSKLTGVLFQPATFFRTMPSNTNRQYLWIMLLILVLISASAVQRSPANNTTGSAQQPGNFGPDGSGFGAAPSGGVSGIAPQSAPLGGGTGGGGGGGGSGGGGGGGLTPPVDGSQVTPGGSGAPISEVWTTIMLACAGMFAVWITQSILLCEVSLFNATAPNWGRNFQIAVWASIPLGLMGGLQLLYQSAGGQISQPGLSGLIDLVPGYNNMPTTAQQVINGLASNFTLFGLWSLLLLYLGARYGLKGKRITSLLVVTLWLLVIMFAPVAFESIKAARRSARNSAQGDIGTPPVDMMINNTPGGFDDAMPSLTPSPSGSSEPPVKQGSG